MKQVQSLEFTLLYLDVHLISVAMKLYADQHQNIGFCEKRSELEHVSLVVDDFALDFGTLHGLELTPADRVSCANDKSLTYFLTGSGDNLVTNFNHGLVNRLGVSSHFEGAILVDEGKACEHVGSGDANLIKHEPAVVLGVVSKLGADVANLDTLEGKVSLQISDWDQEALDTVVVLTNFTLSEDGRMISPQAQASRPVLR